MQPSFFMGLLMTFILRHLSCVPKERGLGRLAKFPHGVVQV